MSAFTHVDLNAGRLRLFQLNDGKYTIVEMK